MPFLSRSETRDNSNSFVDGIENILAFAYRQFGKEASDQRVDDIGNLKDN